MEKFYDSKMNELGYSQLITDIFYNWENVKDEILLKERKDGTGSGTVHVFLGAADPVLRQEFASYYDAVENGEEPSVGAVSVRHYFLANNVLSMIGYLCQYYQSKHIDFTSEVRSILNELNNADDESGLLTTTSLFKLSTGSNKLRPYFKQFDERGVFYHIVRHILLPQSAYKISLYKNEEGEYAAFWLIGFDKLSNFEANSSKSLFNESIKEGTQSLQQIYYGAPGTGKSHEINILTEGEEVIRTTFHPDSDYSTFVGCYKPHMEEVDMTTVIGKELIVVRDESGQPKKEKRIVYKYSCQAFLQAYIAAWQHPDKAQYLVIEEINRGNCAQIFGDIFQLLDRNNEGYSSYPIKTDADAEDELRAMFTKEWNITEEKGKEIEDLYRKHYPDGITKSIKGGSILLLPSNLYIWATMNTSDQSLFPIDSAFKRRWDWKYVKIAEGRDSETKELLNWVVKFDYEEEGKSYTFECSWWQFILAINEKIANATSSDDKKLGYFFCKPKTQDSKEIDAERFVGKVVFYLWNDVFKDEDNAIFKVVEGKGDPSFDTFYTEDDNGKTIADTKALRVFMHNVFGEQSELYTETAKGTKDTAETVTE